MKIRIVIWDSFVIGKPVTKVDVNYEDVFHFFCARYKEPEAVVYMSTGNNRITFGSSYWFSRV